LTRWSSTNNNKPYLPTWNCSTRSGSQQGNGDRIAFDAPNNKGLGNNDVAWGLYSIRITTRNFDKKFNLNLRDANWINPYEHYRDTRIWYYTSEPHLRYVCSNGNTGTVNSSDTINTIWDWYGRSQNKEFLLVPVAATNNFSGGKIKMDGATYSIPKTLNWGWTTTHTIAAVSPQYVDGKKYTFQKWSDGATQLSRSLTIDDHHNSYTFIANFTTLTATMSGPTYLDPYEVGTFTANPSGGVTPYDYTWYRMELGGGPEPLSGGVEPLGPPSGVWIHLSQFDGSKTATSSGVYPGFNPTSPQLSRKRVKNGLN